MKINLSHIKKDLYLEIKSLSENAIIEISDEEVNLYGEAKYQLKEGCSYEYQFSDENIFFKEASTNNLIVNSSKFSKNRGTINPNIYVGTHTLEIEGSTIPLFIEVQSVKSSYRKDYRFMIESITEKCTDLIMQIDSPVSQNFETDFSKSPETLYQRFSFVKALIDSQEFEEAIQKIISNPTTKWDEEIEEKDIRKIKRFNQKSIRQLVTKTNRIAIHKEHYLNSNYGLVSIPSKIDSARKRESIDTAENRFVKHALEEFLFFCENCENQFQKFSRAKSESNLLVNQVSNLLNQTFFKEISRPSSLKLNSPVLQRKSGYREVLNAWLKFDLAAKLVWAGGDDVYKAGKKDVAVLYEYWLFFTLLDLLKDIFKIESKSIDKLIQSSNGRISLTLKQGSSVALSGVYQSDTRNFNIQFSYNRPFGGGKSYPQVGSYTTSLRPDYTLSIWPEEIKSVNDAEKMELITHIHFDAKYKVDNFYTLISKSQNEELSVDENDALIKEEIEEVKSGSFKNQDLLKMHAYKDAIRRTAGAYVLYPGNAKEETYRGFHELIPGLGAFAIRPEEGNTGIEELRNFIVQVMNNFRDRSSNREHLASKIFTIHKKHKPDNRLLHHKLPEFVAGEKLIPQETNVILGYYHEEQLNWIQEKKKYNIRYVEDYPISESLVNAKFLVLYNQQFNGIYFYEIGKKGPVICSKDVLFQTMGYPKVPSVDTYLLFDLKDNCELYIENIGSTIENILSSKTDKKPLVYSLEALLKY
jgi:predicted component of viral defense system (DUF524 family)